MFSSVLLVFALATTVCIVSSASVGNRSEDFDVGVEISRKEFDVEKEINKIYDRLKALELRVCPPGFISIPSVNGCYKVNLNNRPWVQAAHYCRTFHKDAHLIVIDSAAEQQALINMMAHHYNDFSLRGCTHGWNGVPYWTAGQRIASSKSSPFVWKVRTADAKTTIVSHMSYTNWWPGLPNYGNMYEDCMMILPIQNYRFAWDDIECKSWFCSICEIDMNP